MSDEPQRPAGSAPEPPDGPPRLRPAHVALIALAWFLVALAIRTAGLSSLPPGNWYDEAINGLDALEVMADVREGRAPAIFFTTEGHPREPLFIYATAATFWVCGVSTWSLRWTAAWIGALTVAVFWLALRELRGWQVATIAAAGLLFLRWHVHFSRTSFRTVMAALFVCLVLWGIGRICRLAWVAFERIRLRDYALVGLFLGLGSYTYLSFRLVPALAVLWIAATSYAVWADGPSSSNKETDDETNGGLLVLEDPWLSCFLHAFGRGSIFAFVVAFIVFLPLGLDYKANPSHFTGRTAEVGLFDEGFEPGLRSVAGNLAGNVLQFFPFGFPERSGEVLIFKDGWGEGFRTLAGNTFGTVGGFFGFPRGDRRGWGDHVPKHNIPYRSVFGPIGSLLFLVGLCLCIGRFLRPLAGLSPTGFHEGEDPPTPGAVPLLWLAAMLMGSVLSFGAPNLLRTLAGAPAAIWIWTEGVWLVSGLVSRRAASERRGQWRMGVAIAFVAVFGATQTFEYFRLYPNSEGLWRNFNTGETEVGRTIALLDPEREVVWVGSAIADTPTVKFESGTAASTSGTLRHLALPEAYTRAGDAPRDHLILATMYNGLFGELRRIFPGSSVAREFRTPNGRPWALLVRIPARDLLSPEDARAAAGPARVVRD